MNARFIPPAPVRPSAVQSLAVDLIDFGDRLRPIEEPKAAAFAEDIAANGLLQPILVRPLGPERFGLVAGAHRLRAVQLLGWAEVDATIRDMTELEARLFEVNENLIANTLSTLDRAIFIAERERVWVEIHPEAGRGGDRKSQAAQEKIKRQTLPLGFSRGAAESIGLSERTVRSAVALARSLSAEVIPLARATYLADHGADLAQLARLRPDQQLFAVEAIAEGRAKKLKDSLAALGRGPTPADEQERLFQAFVGAWGRMNAKTRKRVAIHINGGKGNGEAARQEPGET